ncbi:hypothetical protein [Acinetobacter wuhouensis]|uniref:Uncharacterized protein n=1 Tax=Acinetobacter wuhouensis TaxID=1879050 RepID=A0A3G2T4R1_9GAMM|nr:hypothetical protein [Acinetobacter wuhouensis]AYO55270.1 hypothetical protein CDG68_17120 [Acinetobacter wuhouensis]
MPNQINSNNTPKTYDAMDLNDAYSLAECDMRWMSVAITDIKKRIKELEKNLGILATGFYDLKHVIDLYQYVAENRLQHYEEEAETYQTEYNANKKAVTL